MKSDLNMKSPFHHHLAWVLLAGAIVSAPVSAHPLGNESVTHFSILRLTPTALEVDLVLDIAEIPSTVLLTDEIDADGDGQDSEAELETWLTRKADDLASQLRVTCDGSPVSLRPRAIPSDESGPDARPPRIVVKTIGAAGMPTYRLAIRYAAEWPAAPARGRHTLVYEDSTFPDRTGLAVILLDRSALLARCAAEDVDPGVLDAGTLPASVDELLRRKNVPISPRSRIATEQPGSRWRLGDPSMPLVLEIAGDHFVVARRPRVIVDEPRPLYWDECEINPFLYDQYDPADMPNERKTTLSFHVEFPPQSVPPRVSQTATQAAGPETLDYRTLLMDPRNDPARRSRSQRDAARLISLLRQPWGGALLLSVTALCFVWGAAHALMPGHAKTLVAAYLISRSAAVWHAILLAIVVTITHTALVVLLGLVVWSYQRTHPRVGPAFQLWLGTIAGLLVAGMGLNLLRRAVRGDHQHGHNHSHDHAHPHGHSYDHDHAHDHNRPRDHGHPHDRGHAEGESDRVTFRLLVMLGITGGLVPCPTATIVMLLGISANVVLGALYAVGVFSLGLALTLMAVGFLALYSRRFALRLMADADRPSELAVSGRWLLNRVAPAVSGLVVLALGIALTAHYIQLLRTGLPLFSWLQ